MIELKTDFELLHECLTIYRSKHKIGLQAFEHITLAISYGSEETCKACIGDVAFGYIGETAVLPACD